MKPVKTLSLAESHYILRLRRIKWITNSTATKRSGALENIGLSMVSTGSYFRHIRGLQNTGQYVWQDLDMTLVGQIRGLSHFRIFNRIEDQKVISSDIEDEKAWIFEDPFRVFVDVQSLKLVSSAGNPIGVSEKIITPWGLASHPNGNIYYAEVMTGRVIIVDRELRYVRTMGSPAGKEARIFKNPRAITISIHGLVAVVDISLKNITILDEDDTILKKIPEIDEGLFLMPSGIAFDLNGDIYVTDLRSANIVKIKLSPSPFGIASSSYSVEKFEAPPEFEYPGFSSPVVNGLGEVFAIPSKGSSVYVYSTEGKLLRTISIPQVTNACHMTFGPGDGFTLSARSNNKIFFFDRNGSIKHEMDMKRPTGATFNIENEFYIISQETGRIYKYSV